MDYAGLAKAGFPVICIETRHAQAVLSARPNKTDRNDARGIAQMMRVGLYLPVHVKTLASQKIRALLSGRRFLQSKLLDVENSIRGLLRNFGLKVGVVSRAQYERRILELIEDLPSLSVIIEPMLAVRRVVREQYVTLHKKMLALARADGDCLLLMSAPGVGPFVA
jgi:transposase